MARRFRFDRSMLHGHPGDVARAVRRIIVRGANHGLIVTSTTDGSHAPFSWHFKRPPRNFRGRAVDFGNTVPGTPEARTRMVRFQRFLLETFGPGPFHELFGPDNALNVKNGVRITLLEGTDLEQAHDTHVHVAPRAIVALPSVPQIIRDRRLARRAHAAGAEFAFKIIRHARKHPELNAPLALAVVEHESGFRNVWGGDGEPNGGTTGLRFRTVTRDRYLQYRGVRGPTGRGGMQGVGLTQLTFFSLQDEADRLGGCWRVGPQLQVGFAHLALLVKVHGERKGLAVYNGGGANPNFAYADSVLGLKARWRERLA